MSQSVDRVHVIAVGLGSLPGYLQSGLRGSPTASHQTLQPTRRGAQGFGPAASGPGLVPSLPSSSGVCTVDPTLTPQDGAALPSVLLMESPCLPRVGLFERGAAAVNTVDQVSTAASVPVNSLGPCKSRARLLLRGPHSEPSKELRTVRLHRQCQRSLLP